MTIPSFETTWAIPLHCQACVDSITTALSSLSGIQSITPSLESQTVTISSNLPPSTLQTTLQSTGRDAILRGAGQSSTSTTNHGAAVCILETHCPSIVNPLRGLVRLVGLSDLRTIFDVTLNGMQCGKYALTVRKSGDISNIPSSIGAIYPIGRFQHEKKTVDDEKESNCTVDVGEDGKGSAFLDMQIGLQDLIGRSILLTSQVEQAGREIKNDENTLIGVIARSAGLWDNEKTICSCSGKTIWQEREEQKSKGML